MLFCLPCCPWWLSQALESEQASLLQHMWSADLPWGWQMEQCYIPCCSWKKSWRCSTTARCWREAAQQLLLELFTSLMNGKEYRIFVIKVVRCFRGLQPLEVKRCSQDDPYPMGYPSWATEWNQFTDTASRHADIENHACMRNPPTNQQLSLALSK